MNNEKILARLEKLKERRNLLFGAWTGEAVRVSDLNAAIDDVRAMLAEPVTAWVEPTLACDEIDRVLHGRWIEMRDSANLTAQAKSEGYVEALARIGLLTADQAELWMNRWQRCPGHDCSRVWCAYCGDIPREDDDG